MLLVTWVILLVEWIFDKWQTILIVVVGLFIAFQVLPALAADADARQKANDQVKKRLDDLEWKLQSLEDEVNDVKSDVREVKDVFRPD